MKQEKVPTIVPSLDQRFACLTYDSMQKTKMKKKKTPSWFYGSNSPIHYRGNPVLPGISAPSHQRSDSMKEDLEKLERIQEWLRHSYKSPVAFVESPEYVQGPGNVNDTGIKLKENFTPNNRKVNKKTKCFSVPAKISSHESDEYWEDNYDFAKSSQINSEPTLPKLQMNKHLTGEPAIIGTSLKSHYRPSGDHQLKRVNNNSGGTENHLLESSSKALPGEITAEEYIQRRSRTYYGMDRSFSDQFTNQQTLRKDVGPIQRPHVVSPMGDILARQRTRYGDTMMHAKSPSKAFSDQKGRTYTLHAKLKDMLLNP